MPSLLEGASLTSLHGKWLRRARPFIFLLCGLAFICDLVTSDTIAVGIVYIPMVCMTLLNKSRRGIWWVAGLAILMVVIGSFIPDINPDLTDLIANRILSVIGILFTAAMVSYAWKIQESLAAQTRRTEEAERQKTEILASISRDLRTPLHAIIATAEVMSVDCQPGQRESLSQVQTASRDLLTRINELVELMKVDRTSPRSKPLDRRPLRPQGVTIGSFAPPIG